MKIAAINFSLASVRAAIRYQCKYMHDSQTSGACMYKNDWYTVRTQTWISTHAHTKEVYEVSFDSLPCAGGLMDRLQTQIGCCQSPQSDCAVKEFGVCVLQALQGTSCAAQGNVRSLAEGFLRDLCLYKPAATKQMLTATFAHQFPNQIFARMRKQYCVAQTEEILHHQRKQYVLIEPPSSAQQLHINFQCQCNYPLQATVISSPQYNNILTMLCTNILITSCQIFL